MESLVLYGIRNKCLIFFKSRSALFLLNALSYKNLWEQNVSKYAGSNLVDPWSLSKQIYT